MNKRNMLVFGLIITLSMAMYFYFLTLQKSHKIYIGGHSKSFSYIYEFNLNDRTVIKHSDWLKGADWPNSVALDRKNLKLYIAGQKSYASDNKSQGIDIIDLRKNKWIKTIPLDGPIYHMALSPNNNYLYVSNPEPDEEKNVLSWKIEIETGKVKEKINLAINPDHHFFVNDTTVLGMSPKVKYLYDLKKDTFAKIMRGKSQIVANGGLNHPNMSFEYPYIEVRKGKRSEGIVDIYDRETMEKITTITLSEQIDNFGGVADRWPVISSDGHFAVFRGKVNNEESKTALFFLDIDKKDVIWVYRFKDQLMDLSNVVIS